jgi:hypothetical protein
MVGLPIKIVERLIFSTQSAGTTVNLCVSPLIPRQVDSVKHTAAGRVNRRLSLLCAFTITVYLDNTGQEQRLAIDMRESICFCFSSTEYLLISHSFTGRWHMIAHPVKSAKRRLV